MTKLTKNAFLLVALIGGTIGFTSCNSGASNTTANNTTTKNTTVTNTTTTTTTEKPGGSAANTTETTKTETASTGDKIGVPECDEYIQKYEACLSSIAEKYPQVAPTLKTAFEAQRNGFKTAASNPQSKATLATTCTKAIETAKQSTSSYACKW